MKHSHQLNNSLSTQKTDLTEGILNSVKYYADLKGFEIRTCIGTQFGLGELLVIIPNKETLRFEESIAGAKEALKTMQEL